MIIFSDITKVFDGKPPILENLNLTIQKGEKVSIVGPSGCGKSTTLRLLMGLHLPEKGKIIVDGIDIATLSHQELCHFRLKFGMLFQSAALFDSMSVGDNVAFTLRENTTMTESEIKRIVDEKLEMVELPGINEAMPASLSGGQRKRVGLARAIAHNPEIILYDEPTTGLDPILSTNIEDLIIRLNKDLRATTVVVTHQISTILRVSDHIHMIENKSVLPPETPATIYSGHPSYQEFITGGLS